jgi:hypothetical protein
MLDAIDFHGDERGNVSDFDELLQAIKRFARPPNNLYAKAAFHRAI